jgi:predicted nicotinamide N-methyase
MHEPVSTATREEWFEEGELRLTIRMPASAEDLIDEAEFDRDERLPYWAELWPSARALARHVIGAGPSAPVLELGCGLALPSLALHARGACVLATDYYDEALEFAAENALRNGLPPLPTAALDWRAVPRDFERYLTVIAADVLYERRNADALACALPRLVAPGGRFLLADPGRTYVGELLDRLRAARWTDSILEVREETSDPTTGAVSRVSIVEIRRSVDP